MHSYCVFFIPVMLSTVMVSKQTIILLKWPDSVFSTYIKINLHDDQQNVSRVHVHQEHHQDNA